MMEKALIQGCLDKAVSDQDGKFIGTWMGVDIRSFTKNELLAIFEDTVSSYQAQLDTERKFKRFMKEV
jgi:hypothetical protein